jgi:hypothetical protein
MEPNEDKKQAGEEIVSLTLLVLHQLGKKQGGYMKYSDGKIIISTKSVLRREFGRRAFRDSGLRVYVKTGLFLKTLVLDCSFSPADPKYGVKAKTNFHLFLEGKWMGHIRSLAPEAEHGKRIIDDRKAKKETEQRRIEEAKQQAEYEERFGKINDSAFFE